MKKSVTEILLLAIILTSCETRPAADSKSAEIDKLFIPWNNPNSPGAAVAVMKDGEVIFKKGYGMANLEYNVPITPSSIFHIASESKQYTAFCIVLLAQEGKLGLDDDIRKYLPYVPDFGKTITIRQLIQHTSGLRDQWQLLAIGGQSLDDVITQKQIIKLIENQRELNFEPGTQQRYCNTGYTLLAEIVRKVSGKSLREFADDRIFKPLGMNHTHFHDDNTEIVPGRTYSYDSIGKNKYANSPLNYATVGATSLFTTVEDEAKWLHNYETMQVGGEEAIRQMYEQTVLDDGTKLQYAFALVIDTLKGNVRIGHGGADAGYRTYAVRFPEENLGIIIFSNLAQFNPNGMATKVASLYLTDKSVEKKQEKYEADPSSFALYGGSFHSDEQAVHVVDSGGLYLEYGKQPFLLTPLSDSSFSVFGGYATLTFNRQGNQLASTFRFKSKDEEVLFTRYKKPNLTEEDRAKYVGTYESEELEAPYHIVNENGNLILRHRKYSDAVMTAITRDQFSTPHWWMGNIIFMRDTNGSITGFEVNDGRVLHLRFMKVM
ncbi:MAG TPA: serine hydrolase domain-containing protein [Cyclobacteriaceae bacterium]|nr:serine hydrolase domain-containing protein [Cyclobacteriaceae bacterium]